MTKSESKTDYTKSRIQETYLSIKEKEKKARLEARMFKQMEDSIDIEYFTKSISKNADLLERIGSHNKAIQELKAKCKTVPVKITVAQMPKEKRYNKLKQ